MFQEANLVLLVPVEVYPCNSWECELSNRMKITKGLVSMENEFLFQDSYVLHIVVDRMIVSGNRLKGGSVGICKCAAWGPENVADAFAVAQR